MSSVHIARLPFLILRFFVSLHSLGRLLYHKTCEFLNIYEKNINILKKNPRGCKMKVYHSEGKFLFSPTLQKIAVFQKHPLENGANINYFVLHS